MPDPRHERFAQVLVDYSTSVGEGDLVLIESTPLARPLIAALYRRVIEAVAACEYARSLAEFDANNALSLKKLRDEGAVKILKFDDSLLKALLALSRDVVAEIGADDELSRKIHASYQQFRASIMDWSDISERAYLNSRRLA